MRAVSVIHLAAEHNKGIHYPILAKAANRPRGASS